MTRVVFAHGFTQTGRSWQPIIDALGKRVDDLDAVAPDMAGHGSASALQLGLWNAATRLVGIGDEATYVGYSMGGRVALHAALSDPEDVERLVLIGATAGIDDPNDRAARRASDDDLADHIEAVGVATFLDQWLANPLFAGLSTEAAGREDRLRNTEAGLASSLRLAGTGVQEPLWNRLGEVECPTLILVGERDAKFRALGERMASEIPEARLEVIADSGHSVHLEHPAATVDAIARFLD